MKAAWDIGINTIDTVNAYSNGESERLAAKFIKRHICACPCNLFASLTVLASIKSPRDRGEVLSQRPHIPRANHNTSTRVGSPAQLPSTQSTPRARARLETPYLDLQIHRYGPEVSAERTMKALYDLVESGKVRYIGPGASSMGCWEFAHLN